MVSTLVINKVNDWAELVRATSTWDRIHDGAGDTQQLPKSDGLHSNLHLEMTLRSKSIFEHPGCHGLAKFWVGNPSVTV